MRRAQHLRGTERGRVEMAGRLPARGRQALRRAGRAVVEALEGRTLLAVALSGDLDVMWGTAGVLTSDLGGIEQGRALKVQADGTILVVGSSGSGSTQVGLIARYTAAEALDSKFDADGWKTVDLPARAGDVLNGVAVQSTGKIIVAGTTGLAEADPNRSDWGLMRLLSNGTTDGTFGAAGIIRKDVGGADRLNAVAVDSTDRVIAVGTNGSDLVVRRFSAAGADDATFGDGSAPGQLRLDFFGGLDEAMDVKVQADGKIVVAGYATRADGWRNIAIVRLNSDGTLDATFGTGGKVTTNLGTDQLGKSLLIDAGGKLVVAGAAESRLAAVRYLSTGALDSTFGSGGKLITTTAVDETAPISVAAQANGRLILGGTTLTSSYDRLAVMRLASNGSIDTSFGIDGTASPRLSYSVRAGGVAVDADGKVLVGGLASKTTNDLMIARLHTLDENTSVVARVNGPYTVSEGGTLQLSALARATPGAGIASSSYEWDLNYDGVTFRPSIVGVAAPVVVANGWNGPALRYIAVRVTDSTLQQAIATSPVTVLNTAPTLAATGGPAVSEGNLWQLDLSALDVGSDPIQTWTINWGDGTQPEVISGSTTSAWHAYPDGDRTYTVTVGVNDGDGTYMALTAEIELDRAFGVVGYGTTQLKARSDGRVPVALLSDGKILVAGEDSSRDWRLERFNRTGTPDGTFGTAGTIVSDFLGALGGQARAMSVQSDGKMVVAGTVQLPTTAWAIARYNASGLLDTSFGSGGTLIAYPGGQDLYGMAVRPDGRIVVAGSANGKLALGQFTAAGAADTTFGVNGVVETQISDTEDVGRSLLLQADGMVVVGGEGRWAGLSNTFVLARYDAQGNLDAGFGTGGMVSTDFGADAGITAMALLADGRIVAAGNMGSQWAVAMYSSDGNLDATFGAQALAAGTVAGNLWSVAEQADGKIVLGGANNTGGASSDLALVRLNADGTLDTSFDGDGVFTHHLADGRLDAIRGMAIQGDGKLIAVGGSGWDLRVMRFSLGTTPLASVINQPPSANFAATPSLNEGQTATLSFSNAFDPGSADRTAGLTYRYDLDGDGLFEVSTSLATQTVQLADNGVYTVRGQVMDKDGATSPVYLATVTVSNVTPTIALAGAATSDEGAAYTLSLGAVSDPGADTVSQYIVNWGDGSSDTLTSQDLADNGPDVTHVYADGPSTRTIIVSLVDEDGTYLAAGTLTVSVLNVAPTATFAADNLVVDEWIDVTVSFSDQADPSVPDLAAGLLYSFDLDGDGVFEISRVTSAAQTLRFTSGGTYTINGLVEDRNGATSPVYTLTFTVSEVILTATFAADNPTVDEGEEVTVSFSNEAGPAPADLAAGLLYSFDMDGDGIFEISRSSSAAQKQRFDDNGTYTVNGFVEDRNGTTSQVYTLTITVNNVAPTAAITAPASVDEGQVARVSLGGVADPGVPDMAAGFLYSFDLDGDGTFEIIDSTTDWVDVACPDDGILTVKGQVKDKDSGVSEILTATITVNNVAPTASISGAAAVDEGAAYTLSLGAVSDPGTDTVSQYIIYWGDGSSQTLTSQELAANGPDLTHAYGDGPQNYTILLSVVDEDGTFDNLASLDVSVANLPPAAQFAVDQTLVNEGGSVTVSFSAEADPSSADVAAGFTYSFDLDGDGVYEIVDVPERSQVVSFPDNGTRLIRGQIKDKDGATAEYVAALVTVQNVAPTALFAASADVVDEGGSVTVSFSDEADISATDAAAGFTYSFDLDNDGTYEIADVTQAAQVVKFADNGTYTIRGLIRDKDGGSSAYTLSVQVNNLSPAASFAATSLLDEGGQATISFADETDASTTDLAAGFFYHFDLNNDGVFEVQGRSSSVNLLFADDGQFTVRGRIADKDGGLSPEYTAQITVQNVNPSFSISGAAGTDEAATYTLSLGAVVDPGTDTVSQYTVDWGDGQIETFTSGGNKTHVYADGPGTMSIKVSLTDEDGTYADAAGLDVSVNNLPPSALLSGMDIFEGDVATISFSGATDPSAVDVAAGFTYSFDLDNDGIFEVPRGPVAAQTLAYADQGTYTVAGRVYDKDGTYRTYYTAVRVSNVAPTAVISGTLSMDEGSSGSVQVDAALDPSSVDLAAGLRFSYDLDGNGSFEIQNVADRSAAFTFAESGTYTVQVLVMDKDGGQNVYPLAVTVSNVAPTANFFASTLFAEEGGVVMVMFTSPWDASVADTAAGFLYSYDLDGDGIFEIDSVGSSSQTASFPDDGTHTISGRILDKDGGFTTYAVEVVVDNVAPSIAISGNNSVDEGALYTLQLGNVSDPGTDTVSQYIVNWGDGTSDTYTSAGNKTHVFTDGSATRTISVALVDEEGIYFGAASKSVVVRNIVPTLTLTPGPAALLATQPYRLGLGSSDAGADTIASWHIDWGDGNEENVAGNPSAATHIYRAGGTYTITAWATDEDGTHASSSVVSVRVFGLERSVRGSVFYDANGDGRRSSGEKFIAGRVVFLDRDNDGVLDVNERSATTDAAGQYAFGEVIPGAYRLGVVTGRGWRLSLPAAGYSPIKVAPGKMVTGKTLGLTQKALVSGTVFADRNANRRLDAGEKGLAKVRVFADRNNNGRLDRGEQSVLSDANGVYVFRDLSAGKYFLRVAGKTLTSPAGARHAVKLARGQALGGKDFGVN